MAEGIGDRMFWRKKRLRAMMALADEAGTPLYQGPQDQYILPEAEVVRLSILYFNDPEPCAIHRGAVCQRVLMEMGDRYGGVFTPLAEADRAYFPGAAAIRLWEEEV